MFRGSYDSSEFLKNGNIISFNVVVCKNKNNLNLCACVFNIVSSPTIERFILETYTISSYNSDNTKQKGVITFTNLFNNSGSGIVNAPEIVAYTVTGVEGIYSYVKKVIIDFNNSTRQVYFCS